MLGAGHIRYGRLSEEVAFELRASGGRGGLPQIWGESAPCRRGSEREAAMEDSQEAGAGLKAGPGQTHRGLQITTKSLGFTLGAIGIRWSILGWAGA